MPDNQKFRGTALVVHPVMPGQSRTSRFTPAPEEKLNEAEGLAQAIFLDVTGSRIVKLNRPTPATLLGKGTCDSLAEEVTEKKPDVVIINHTLSPVQQRNLEKHINAKVIDRTGLILEIFGERAQTREGQIQVDLAALEYQKSRLVRSWTHLERQRGGTGTVGGPGETQLEIDRRLITDKITKLKKDLIQVSKNRDLQRKSRERVPYPIVALVGYTNAGKSTLFNRMTGASVFAEDLLFATLDPTMRKVKLINGQDIILSDTVGFIADLPTHLVAAFRSTLEQVEYADVILHVRDVSRPDHESQKLDVIKTLGDLDIEYDSDPRIIEVLNKIDALDSDGQQDILRQADFQERAAAVSALTGKGMAELLAQIEKMVSGSRKTVKFRIPPADGKALAWLYSHGNVTERYDNDKNITITVDMEPANLDRFLSRHGYKPVKTG
jgi:GTPase